MSETIILSALTIICWGAWGIFAKIAIGRVGWPTALLLSYLISAVLGFILLFQKATFKIGYQNFIIIVLSALTVSLGSFFFYLLLNKKQASIVVPLTSLYPVITIILGVLFLREILNVKQVIGIIFALIAIFLLSM